MSSGHLGPLLRFPAPQLADATGLVAITPDINWQMLLSAYAQGIFPWADDPVRWYSPDPRAIFERDQVALPSNLAKLVRRAQFTLSYDSAFAAVMQGCAQAHQADGVWITPRFQAAYAELHARGFAHSVEVWQHGALVGGLYGVQIGQMFAGESMFHSLSNASKAAFQGLLTQLDRQGVTLLDAQVRNAHTERLGACEVARSEFLSRLARAVVRPAPGSGARWLQSLP